jgi:hypothetical protein
MVELMKKNCKMMALMEKNATAKIAIMVRINLCENRIM